MEQMTNWLAYDLAIVNGAAPPEPIFGVQTLVGGMPITAPPAEILPAVAGSLDDGMPITGTVGQVLTPANAPAGVTFLTGNMPLTEPLPIAAPLPASTSFLVGDMPITGPIVPELTPATAPAGVTFLTGNMPLGFGDGGHP